MSDGPTVVSPEWLETHRDDDEVVVVDVREARDYAELGHVPGAVNVSTDEFRDPSSVAAGKLPAADDFAALMREAGIAEDDAVVAVDGSNGVNAARFLLTGSSTATMGRSICSTAVSRPGAKRTAI